MNINNMKIAVIGLGYVGLPLAVEFSKKRKVVAFDINTQRIAELRQGIDRTNEIEANELHKINGLKFTSEIQDIKKCKISTTD